MIFITVFPINIKSIKSSIPPPNTVHTIPHPQLLSMIKPIPNNRISRANATVIAEEIKSRTLFAPNSNTAAIRTRSAIITEIPHFKIKIDQYKIIVYFPVLEVYGKLCLI